MGVTMPVEFGRLGFGGGLSLLGHGFTSLIGWGMQISLIERMLMAQNFEILAKLNPQEATSYEWRAEVLRSGYEPLYSWLFEYFGQGDQIVTQQEGEYVFEVLHMYDAIAWSIKNQKLNIPDELKYHAAFPGFDGNEEGKLLGFANHFCADENRYATLKKDGEIPNSHMPTYHIYEPMLAVWKPIAETRTALLSEEQVLALLRAR
jgi:uncharacterized protein YfbU (UPF0304 family)